MNFFTGWCAGKAFEHAWKSDRTEYFDDHLLCPCFYSRSGNDGIVYDGNADGT